MICVMRVLALKCYVCTGEECPSIKEEINCENNSLKFFNRTIFSSLFPPLDGVSSYHCASYEISNGRYYEINAVTLNFIINF